MAAFTLGLKPVEETRMENWVEFETGVTKFPLHAIPSEIADQIQISSPPRPREQNSVKLSFEVDDIASERQRLESLGVTCGARGALTTELTRRETFSGFARRLNLVGALSSIAHPVHNVRREALDSTGSPRDLALAVLPEPRRN